jgi:hypothetical protein
MKIYGYLRSADEAFQIFSAWHAHDGHEAEFWAGVYLHWRDGFILIIDDKHPDTAPYPYEDATLHWEMNNGDWHKCATPNEFARLARLARPGWPYHALAGD